MPVCIFNDSPVLSIREFFRIEALIGVLSDPSPLWEDLIILRTLAPVGVLGDSSSLWDKFLRS